MSDWEFTLTVRGVKDEHAAWNAKLMMTVERLFHLDGADVTTDVSAEKGRDGQERIYEFARESDV